MEINFCYSQTNKKITEKEARTTIIILDVLFYSYKKDCYNDSTKQCVNVYLIESGEYYTPCSKHDFDLGFNSNYKETKEIWTHKQPSFEGFMEYIKTFIK
jgi:hypothetical protein